MGKVEPLRQLSDALELLGMLEYLSDRLTREETPNADIPWGGFKLSLRQAREIITAVREKLAQGLYAEPSAPPRRDLANAGGATLAERVQQIPISGRRAREISASASNALAAEVVADSRAAGDGLA